jgi:hypothetical protein
MSIRTMLGPILAGTQKNNNASIVNSTTPSAAFLGNYRNTGPGDAYQFISVPQASLTALATGAFPYTYTPTYSVGGVLYPVVIPAGSYIEGINLDITTAFTFGGTPTGFVISFNLIGTTNSAYTTAQTVATAGTAASVTVLNTVGRYVAGNTGVTNTSTSPLSYTGSATPLAMLSNTGVTDTMLQIVYTFTAGTSPTITAGAFSLAIDYCLRNPDGTWYPQTPPATGTTFPITY